MNYGSLKSESKESDFRRFKKRRRAYKEATHYHIKHTAPKKLKF